MNLRLCAFLPFVLLASLTARADTNTLASITVPEGFEVTLAAGPDLSSYPMFMEFDDQGRLFIAESTGKDLSGQEMAAAPECTILRLTDVDGDGVYDERTVFARELSLPMGVLWHQGALFVASPPDFVRLEDTDDDGVADQREVLLTGWNVYNTASLHGPFLGPDGLLYLTHGRHGYKITTKEGEVLEGLASRIWRCKPDGTQLERFAGGGFDNPVEIIFTPGGDMLGTMTYFTDPKHGQRDALMHWVWGGVYPKPHPSSAEFLRTGDLMPVMSKYSRIAPAGILQYRSTTFGAEYTGDLFSAQFNPHRVMRHKLLRDGATWRTEDEDFLVSDNPDFYPTDVLEDADGSLLVSDTGAWYVDACPISRVAKPDVRGSIYRIRRTGAEVPADPWGSKMDWSNMDTESTVAALGDDRFRVRQNALQNTIAHGTEAAPALRTLLSESDSIAARIGAISALYQIDAPTRLDDLKAATKDADESVRIAGARALGELGDGRALSILTDLLTDTAPPVRREAAAALGKIGDKRATPALLNAAAGPTDRFEEHAAIYALIELGDTTTLFDALRGNRAWPARKAALIALDQLKAEGLAAADALPFLETGDPALHAAALWVASRHEDWAADILRFVAKGLDGNAPVARETLREILLAYAGTEACQTFIADRIKDRNQPLPRRTFLLDIVEAGAPGDLPAPWVEVLDWCLYEQKLQQRAMAVIQTRNLTHFDDTLGKIADDGGADPVARLEAIAVLSPRMPTLDGKRLGHVLGMLKNAGAPLVRRTAAQALSSAALDRATKATLIAGYLPEADGLMLATVLTVLEGESDPALGTAFVNTVADNVSVMRLMTLPQLDRVLTDFPPSVHEAAAPLRDALLAQAGDTMERFLALEPRLGTGDVGRGRAMFFSELAQCSLCHAIGDEGGHLGPDLTTIGVVRSGHDLLEAVLFPNASMVPDYVPYLVETEDDLLMGIIQKETADTLTLGTAVNEVRQVPRTTIQSMRAHTISMMPEGLEAAFTDDEMVNLITFLQSLNNERWLLPELWEGKEGH